MQNVGAKGIVGLILLLVIAFAGLSYYVQLRPASDADQAASGTVIEASGELYPVPHRGKWGFMDGKGRLVVQPRFQMVSEFHEGLAAAMINDRWGFINRKGEMAIPAHFENVSDFHEGLCV